jgi:hypothetical protein
MKFEYRGAECVVFDKDGKVGAAFLLPIEVKIKPEFKLHEIKRVVTDTIDLLIERLEEI